MIKTEKNIFMQDTKLQKIAQISNSCFANVSIDPETVSKFCTTLKKSCEDLREKRVFKGKKDEQTFCQLLIDELIKRSETRATEILKNSIQTKEEKALQLTHLAYVSLSLIALTKIQHRFGGRLGYHCLPHTQNVAQYPDFLIICVAAFHDAVMRYTPPPDFQDPLLVILRKDYHQFRDSLDVSKAHQQLYDQRKNEIEKLKTLTEQKRFSGWKDGDSERDSYHQLEAQLVQLLAIIEACDVERKNTEAITLFKNQIQSLRDYRSHLIKGTIPTMRDFCFPGLGDKLDTIGNVKIFPGPAELVEMEPTLRNRLVHLMDRVIQEIKGPQALTFKQALDDIKDARTFYDKVVAAQTVRSSVDLEAIKASIRTAIKNKKNGNLFSHDKVPRFETMNKHVLFEMPPFNDPMKQLQDVPQEEIIHRLKDHMIQDVVQHHGDVSLILYFKQQIENNIVANLDLGGLMKKGAEIHWLQHEILGLIAEQHPYQSQQFFLVNQKLLNEGSLANERNHMQLREERYRSKWKITDEEYRGALEFMDIAYFFLNQNMAISQGALLRTQFYIYQPMKALQLAFEDPVILAKSDVSDSANLDQIIHNFEKDFCINGKLRNSIVNQLKRFIDDSLSASSLCFHILTAMESQFGSHYLKAPQDYGYTIGNHINSEFLAEQNQCDL